MVTIDFSQKLVRCLELYLLKRANFKLPVRGYDLILLLPIAPDSWSEKRTLLVSASDLLAVPRWDATYELLAALRAGLSDDEYLFISNVDLIEPSACVVQQVKRYVANREEGEVDAPISLIGGVTNQIITAINSTVLDELALSRSYDVALADGVISGELTALRPNDNASDAELSFSTASGPATCLFSSIVRLKRRG